jgi:hypothetical protein
MRTLTNLHGTEAPKKRGIGYYLITFLVVELVFIGLLLISHASMAQTPGTDNTESTLVNMKSTFAGGKVYTKWYVQNENEDGIFLVERSKDNVEFQVIGAKHGVGVPSDLIIMYSYIDEDPGTGPVWYRLRKVYEDGMGYASDSHKVIVPALGQVAQAQ